MRDYISRQAAIDALADYIHNVDKVIGTGKLSTADCRDAAESVLEELPSAQQWIPCSDRLPEEDFWNGRGRQFSDHVLVTIVNHVNDDGQITDIAQTVDGIWRLSHDVDGDCSLPNWCEVIAWMPLPEPWKGE